MIRHSGHSWCEMDCDVLNVEMVETLHRMQEKGKPIVEIVNSLRSVTLAGLIEYGCLRHSRGDEFPSVFNQVGGSPLALALCEVCSDLGLRASGVQKPPVMNLEVRPAEFHCISMDCDLDEDAEWCSFRTRFEWAARNIGFSTEAAANLQSALFEMAENAVLHSFAPICALVGYEIGNGAALFTVADVGIGALKSLRSNPSYSHLSDDVEAIRLALRSGVTSRLGENGGLGFNSVIKALAAHWGQLRFRSGNGCVTMDGTHIEADKTSSHRPPPLPGFQVSVCCRLGDDNSFQSLF